MNKLHIHNYIHVHGGNTSKNKHPYRKALLKKFANFLKWSKFLSFCPEKEKLPHLAILVNVVE